MVRSKKLEFTLPNFLPLNQSELQQIFEALREGGMLPTGGRGPHAPHLSPEHAATIAIAVCCPTAWSKSAEFALEWGRMKPAGTRYSPFCGAETLRAALARILEDPAGELGVKEVRITQHWPRAAIYRTNGDEYLFGFSDFIKAQEHGFKIFPSRFEMVLSASTLCQLALELSEEK